jgi:hypothetical protein
MATLHADAESVGAGVVVQEVQLHCIESHVIVSRRIVSHRTALHRICGSGTVLQVMHLCTNESCRIVLHCIASRCNMLCCTHSTVLHRIASHFIASYCIVLHRIASYCVVLCRIASHRIASFCVVLHRIVLHCLALPCIVLYCIASYCTPSLASNSHLHLVAGLPSAGDNIYIYIQGQGRRIKQSPALGGRTCGGS